MYTTQRNLQILLSLLKQNDIRNVVISPGSRNLGLVRSVQSDPFFTCYSVVDERSAAYFAIGIATAKQEPVVLTCTSAQATRNYIPGMTEAYHRETPLVVVTADYRPALIGQGTMQALDQMSIPSDAAKMSVSLPEVHTDLDAVHCERLVNEALLELDHRGRGPVHINVPTADHWPGGTQTLTQARRIIRHETMSTAPTIGRRKVLVVVGQCAAWPDSFADALDAFSSSHDVAVYVNPLSNYRGSRSIAGNLVIKSMEPDEFKALAPDILVTIGGQVGDYAIDSFARHTGGQHWRVHPDGAIRDTYGRLTHVFEMAPEQFFAHYADASSGPVTASYWTTWRQAKDRLTSPSMELPLSQASIAHAFAPQVPPGSHIHFGILSAFRNWSHVELPDAVTCHCNVAAYGIDGCVSTYVGHAVASEVPVYLVVGDLAFFYDMNIAGNRHIGKNVRILLVNNSGGGEFQLYTHAASTLSPQASSFVAGSGHFGSAKAWVESMGWDYRCVTDARDLESAAKAFFGADGERPLLVEVFTTMSDDSDAERMLIAANLRSRTLREQLIASMSPDTKRRIKTLLGRRG